MRRPRIFVDLELPPGAQVSLPARPSQHLIKVLRLRAGDPLILFNGDGREVPSRLVGPTGTGALVATGDPGDPEPPYPLKVHLGIGVSRGERMDVALQKAVELGVSSIAPLFSRRSVVRLSGERLEKRHRHWQGVIIAACEQSGRRRLPRLDRAASLEAWLSADHPHPFLLDHRSPTPLPSATPPADAVTLLVGPEGGLAPAERVSAHRAGFVGVRLGPRVLRTETAPIAALAAIQALWGDFRA
jgi:16S rRNA (uracil1498-N3)-methyltransferase